MNARPSPGGTRVTTAVFPNDNLLPRPAGGNGPGAALALIVHAGLITALTLGVDWRTHSSEVVSAELWASVPQSAAAPPPAPPPPLPEPLAPAPAPAPAPPAPPAPVARTEPPAPAPDITLERERKKAEAQRKKTELEAEAERKRNADKKKLEDERKAQELKLAQRETARLASEKTEDDRLARQREENLRRMLGQAGATAANASAPSTRAGTAAQNAAPSASYGGLVRAKIRPLIVFTGYAEFNAAAEVEVILAPGGSVTRYRLIKSSGYKDWDEAVMRAIDKAGSMPRDIDGRVPPTLILSFKPTE